MKRLGVALGSVLALALIRLLHASCRYRIHGEAHLPAVNDGRRGGFIMAFWHQNLVATILGESGRRNFCTMISRSRDGDIISYVVEHLGHRPARGSTAKRGRDKGGMEAHDALIADIRAGYPGAVTVDGPTGPLYKVKAGVVSVAEHAGVPVVPYFAVATRYWALPSWDRLRIPWPFSTIHVYYGEPVAILPNQPRAEYVQARRRIKDALDALERQHNPRHALAEPD